VENARGERLKIGRKEAHRTDDCEPIISAVKRSKVKVTTALNAVNENQPRRRIGNTNDIELNWDTDGRTMIRITDMYGGRKGQGHQAALGGCSSHHLQGAGPLQAAQLVNQYVVKTRNNVSKKKLI